VPFFTLFGEGRARRVREPLRDGGRARRGGRGRRRDARLGGEPVGSDVPCWVIANTSSPAVMIPVDGPDAIARMLADGGPRARRARPAAGGRARGAASRRARSILDGAGPGGRDWRARMTGSHNFGFLAAHDPELVRLGADAERFFAQDPDVTILRLRQIGELLAQRAAANAGLYVSAQEPQIELLRRLEERLVMPREVAHHFHGLRRAGNVAAHDAQGGHGEALLVLKVARELAVWFHRTFKDRGFKPGPFVPPPDPKAARQKDEARAAELDAVRAELARLRAALEAERSAADAARAAAEAAREERLSAEARARREAEDHAAAMALAEESEAGKAGAERERARLAEELAAVQAKAAAAPERDVDAIIARAQAAAKKVVFDEAATRALVDADLRSAGWEANTRALTHAGGARPQKGRNLAIAEWPTESGVADYVLFAGLVPVGIVEAKRRGKDIPADIEQAKRYGRGFCAEGEMRAPGGPWGELALPFLYATNGRPYMRQLRTVSGIWFLDARRKENHADALDGWHTPEGLLALLAQDVDAANAALRAEPTDYLTFLRDYQREAIAAVEAAIERGQRSCLVAMATGTGKTKTTIALVYRLLKTKRFRRVLFLVDRTALGEQAAGAFKETKLENLQSFADIFGMKELGDLAPDAGTRLHIATVQAMVRRLDAEEAGEARPSVDQYDGIVVDECHRGYLLDREMSDAEMSFRSEADFISAYRRVLDHFDAVKIGLTATPALHTTQIFGEPVYTYGYRQAVIDGFLADHAPPFNITTKLGADGITWAAGEAMQLLDRDRRAIDRVRVPDEVTLEIDTFNRRVITEGFNRAVCGKLAEHIDPSDELKTLVFCVDDAHANMVVDLLKRAFDARYGAVDDDAVAKITGSVDKPLEMIRRFKNERLPNVAVTVDLLTTGIDVPAIGNLVFLRRIKSRILYEQMMGRATRLHPAKEVFRIFDAVALYEGMKDHSDMKPVVVSPTMTFAALAEAILGAKRDEVREGLVDELVAKLQRKKRALAVEGALEGFEAVAGASPAEVAGALRHGGSKDAARWLAAHPGFAAYLDATKGPHAGYILSEHDDEVREVTRGYGKARKPKDYLEAFKAYLASHMNEIPALLVVTQRPRELTRKELKELKLALDAAGFSEAALRTAWRELTNEDIAASIVGHVRRAALGDALVPYAERVARAVRKILASRAFTDPQRKWLERIGKQLELEVVVDRAAFDQGLFKSEGGFARFDKVFEGRLEAILGELHGAIWAAG
jgi:type I restriction enzyme R subunit